MTALLVWLAGTLISYKLSTDLDVWQAGTPIRRDLAAFAILAVLVGVLIVALGTGGSLPEFEAPCLSCPPIAEVL
jgi:hypothetical protein